MSDTEALTGKLLDIINQVHRWNILAARIIYFFMFIRPYWLFNNKV
jgi:hypothetical protein